MSHQRASSAHTADLARTPSAARASTFGVHCFERKFDGEEDRPPVQLVVFDCDETLTLSTFMPKERDFEKQIGWSSWPEYISMMNFGSPFLEENRDFEQPFGENSRLAQLRRLLLSLAQGEDGRSRTLAVLTRNARGAVACLNLLMMAQLADCFSVVWSMSTNSAMPNAVYREGHSWKSFRAPLDKVFDHKADVLDSVVKSPREWFPQMAAGAAGFEHLRDLRMEGIVLVDDVRTNFQSPSHGGAKVLRYCKVARYDAKHPQLGFLGDMGGIGARRAQDFGTLLSFVQEPWKFKEEPHVQCMEQSFEGCEQQPPVRVVIFEFDETLTLTTFMPNEDAFLREIGHPGKEEEHERYLTYNFESPFVPGSRLAKLRDLLVELGTSESREPRSLAVLTENQAGAVAVLNLLLLAGLADAFCAVWAPLAEHGLPRCVCKFPLGWSEVVPPSRDANPICVESKGEMLVSICEKPWEWFPQAFEEASKVRKGHEYLAPGTLRLANIVLIDDERTKFSTSSSEEAQALRFCKVASYDDVYRDQGLLMHMGGIGARSDRDYKLLRYFVDRPWKSRIDSDPDCCPKLQHPDTEDLLVHSIPEDELPRTCLRGTSRARTAPAGQLRRTRELLRQQPEELSCSPMPRSSSSFRMEDIKFQPETL